MLKLLLVLLVIQLGFADYNKARSIDYSYMAAATHCPSSQVQAWTCKLCQKYPYLKQVTYIENKVTKIVGFIGYDTKQKRIVMSWRCTIDFTNFMEDVTFEMMPFPCRGCSIHIGFYEAYKSVEGQVVKKITTLLGSYPNAQIYISGHSLGGALSMISGIQLQLKFGKVAQVQNFGAPRIGNQNLAQFIKTKIPIVYRIIHYRDLAPHLPFQDSFGLKYRHLPYEVLYDQSFANYKVCDESGQDKTCSNQYFPDYRMSDHHVYFVPMEC